MPSKYSLNQVAKLREQAKHREAFILVNQIIWDLAKTRDYKDLASAFGHRSYIYKHLFQLSGNSDYALLALQDAEAQLLIVQKHKLKNQLHTALFILGEMHVLNKNYKLAAKFYKQSLAKFKGAKFEKFNWIGHLGYAIYLAGQKKAGQKLMLQGLQYLKNNLDEVDSFTGNVWLSGAYMRLAEVLKSQIYKRGAWKIIQSDKRLIMRRKQFRITLRY